MTVAAKAAGIDHFSPFDLDFDHLCNILDDNQFENLLQLAHSGLIGAIWSAPPCEFFHSSDKLMEDHHLYDQKNTWMDYHLLLRNNYFRFKNLRRSIDAHLFYVLLFSNKEVSLLKNNQSTLSHGVKPSTNSSYPNALATSLPHLLANGDSIGLKLGPSLPLLIASNHWQHIVITQITKTSEVSDSLVELLSVHLQQNTLLNWQMQSSTL